jgi:tetratricopeptide (TPR) repeat protein
MKPFIITLSIVGVAVAATTLVCLNRQKTPSAPAPVAESSARPAGPMPLEKTSAPKPETPATTPAPASVPPVAAGEPKPDDAADSIRKSVDALLSAKSGEQKHALFEQLARSGRLEEAIAELKQRAVDHPDDPEIPTTLGEAQLNQLRAIRDAGGDRNQIGILAMQADQSFTAALKIDPSNWEAQFVKAASMSHWPADATRDNEVVQRLSSLIDQQDTMTPQPLFAQTYVVLGEQYQKIGKPDYALQTWQLGAQKFPNDPTLREKINNAPRQ